MEFHSRVSLNVLNWFIFHIFAKNFCIGCSCPERCVYGSCKDRPNFQITRWDFNLVLIYLSHFVLLGAVDVVLQELLNIQNPTANAVRMSAQTALLSTNFEEFSKIMSSASSHPSSLLHPQLAILSGIQVRQGEIAAALTTAELACKCSPILWPVGSIRAAEALLAYHEQNPTYDSSREPLRRAFIAFAQASVANMAAADLRTSALLLKGDLQQEDISFESTQVSSTTLPLNGVDTPSQFQFEQRMLAAAVLSPSDVSELLIWCRKHMEKTKTTFGSVLQLPLIYNSGYFQSISIEKMVTFTQTTLTSFLTTYFTKREAAASGDSHDLLGTLRKILEVLT